MNKAYRVVWNESTNTWVAVAEIATARGKSGKAKVVAASVAVVGALASPAHADLIWGSGAKAPGEGSMAMGINSDAKTKYTIAVGQDAVNKSNGDSAVLIGHDAQASSDANPNTGTNTMGQQVVIGESSRANSQSVAVGAQVYATGQASIAIGGDDLGNNDSKTSAGKYTGANAWRNYAGQPITVEGVSTKDASNPAIGFTSTTASGRGSIAIGHMSQSTGKASLAFGADSHAEADGAIAAGMASQAKGSAAVAIGVGAEAPEAHATAIGLKAKANGGNAFAAGSNAKADGKNSISLGSEASTETNSATYYRIKNVPDKTENNIAIGTKARSGGLQTIAFGAESVASKSQSVAFGFDAQATGDQSVALGANTRSMGDSSVAIGGDDLDSVASTVYRTTSASADNDAYNDTPLAKQYRTLTGQNLVDFTPGNRYIGTTTGQAGVAVGVSAKAADLATAVGTKSHATGDYSAALGVGANATLANAVALGAGSTTKTNATDVPSATIGAITYGSATSPFAGSGKVVPGDQVSVGAAGFERQIKHVAPGAITAASTDAINGSQLFYVAKGLQDQISNNSATRSFGVNADNNSLKTHQLGKELAIVAGNTTEATSTSNLKTNVTQDAATGKTTVTVSMKDAPTFASVTTQDAAGNKTVTNAGGVTITPVSGNPVSLTKDGLNNGGNKITGVADGNIAAGSKEAINGGQLHDLKENGFKIAADNGTADTVKLTETVKYTGDSNIVTTVKDNEIGFKLADSITVGPATGGNPVKIDGNAGTVTGLTNKTWDPNNITSGRGATEDQLKAAVATTPLTVANDGKVTPPAAADAGKLATAGDIANAINNSGFQATAGGRLASGTTATATTVKPGQKVTFAAGNGLTVKQDVDATNGDQTYTYALDAQTVVQNAQTPVVYTDASGNKVYKHTDGNFYTQPNGGGTQVAAGNVIASMQNAAGDTTKPTTLANVKGNLADTSNATGNPSGNDRATLAAGNKGNNAATVNDVLNAGFTVQGNGVDKDFVTHGDTINFANGQGTVANVSTAGGVTTVKFDTPMTYADASGNPTATPSNKVNLVGGTAGSPVTLGNVADGNIAAGSKEAVNGGQLHDLKENGFKIAADNGTADTVKLTETVKYTGDSNIVTTVKDNEIGFKLADSITVGPVTGGNPVKIDGNAGTVTGLTNKTWDPNNITSGRGATEDQLKAAQAAATSKVAAGNGISVTPNVDATTGSTTYTVAADTTTLNVGDGTGGNPAGKVITPTGADANKLATAGDIANAINNSGFQATAGGNLASGTTATATTVKPGQQVTFAAGNGLTVKQDVDGTSGNQTYTYALDAQTVVQNAQTPVVYTDTNGNKVYKHADGNFYDKPEGQAGAQQVQASNVIASMQDASGNTTKPTTLANVKGNLADTSNATGNPSGNDRATLAAGNKGNNAATVNDVLNAGFTVQGNGADKDFVTHGDTINFVNGQGTVANVTSTNGVTEVKFDTPLSYADAAGNNTTTPSNAVNLVGSDPSKPVTLGNVAEGVKDTDAVNVAQRNAAKTKVQAADNSPVTVTGTGSSTDPYKVGVNTVTLAPATGTDAGKVAAPATGDAGKLVTAGDIANAINSSGFKATAGGNLKGGTTATQELIKAGDTLTLKAGSGLTVEQTGSSFTYALNAQQVVQDAQTPVVYTKADGSKVYKHTDGNFYDQPNGAGTQVAAGDVIASMQGADGVTTATPATKDADGIMTMAGGTTLNNVASAGDITNPANAYRAVNAGDLNNSVQKLVNNGFKIDADNGTADTVKLGETVKYAGDGNITTTVSNNQIGFKLANTVTIGDAATGGKPVKIDGTAGTVTGLTNITWDPATTPITSGRAATEDQLLAVANAANSAGAGFTIAGNSKAAGVTTADETIKAGETLSIKGTGTGAFTDYDSSNIQTQVGANGEVTVGLKKDLNVNSVTAGNTKVDNGGITITNPTDPSKNVSLTGNGLNNGGNTITNVGDGVNDTDAVNVRQLKAAQTNVNNLTNNVIGTDKPNITTYDVHGNVADNQNSVVEAINNMNTGGIKFFHVNDGTGTQNTAGTLSHPEDSSAKGNYGAAVGYQAKADGESSVAFGKGAQATGKNTIAIGTGNVVTGEGSGAIGDPTTITGRGTYSVGNNNGTISANEAGVFGNNNTLTGDSSRIIGNSSTVTTTDTFVMGNNSTSNVANSVVLGSNAAATSAATASSAGTTTYASSVINGTTYNYAGATPTGVVSVGDVGKERRVQNVAAGLISADSTDAINGSQLYATNSAINALNTGAAGIVQYSNGDARPNGGVATNHVTMVGADQNAPVTVHNVAAGVAPTDAVNVSQLQGVAGQINKVADEADAGTAAAMAAAGLPQAYLPGKSMVAVSGSTYRGKQGYAVGFSAINDGGNWIVKGIATGNSKGKFGATIGAGYQW